MVFVVGTPQKRETSIGLLSVVIKVKGVVGKIAGGLQTQPTIS